MVIGKKSEVCSWLLGEGIGNKAPIYSLIRLRFPNFVVLNLYLLLIALRHCAAWFQPRSLGEMLNCLFNVALLLHDEAESMMRAVLFRVNP